MLNTTELLLIPALPLAAALVVGLFGWALKERVSHLLCIAGVVAAALLSVHVFVQVLHGATFSGNLWTWMLSDRFVVPVGMMIDRLSAVMMMTVAIISACIHVYTIGYMHGDPGYTRFFSYISGFTFSMLVLVMGNNFFTLFFGWEAVGLFSYLLIGFWFKRESANVAAMKAFIVNRVGDFGFAIGILAVWYYFGSIEYKDVFAAVPQFAAKGSSLHFLGLHMNAITFICIALFIGAMGKSAQVPLHVWLPDSMEGPTPISALIHAATMVTAGIFMVARCSPMFEYSETALAVVTVVGAITAWLCATIGLVQTDIKRVIAYSTCSQLGYMFVACGVSAYSVGIFHLMTHAYFKAHLFLAAGSVIHGVMADQDLRRMGQLWKAMPVTYVTMLIGGLALCGVPPFAGFWSKDMIIEAAAARHMGWVSTFAYLSVLTGVFMTAFYTFRMFFLAFHNSDRVPAQTKPHVHESPKVMTVPLLILAVGALFSGWWGAEVLGMTRPEMTNSYFQGAIFVLDAHNPLMRLAEESEPWYHFLLDAPFWLALGGIALAGLMYFKETPYPARLAAALPGLHRFLVNKWWFDEMNWKVLITPARNLGTFLWQKADLAAIDRGVLHGGVLGAVMSGVGRMRSLQTGYVYHYAFAMVVGVFAALTYLALKG